MMQPRLDDPPCIPKMSSAFLPHLELSIFPGIATIVAPRVLTVAASSVDRLFKSNIYIEKSRVLK